MNTLAPQAAGRSIGQASWSVWSTSVTVVVDQCLALDLAAELLRREISSFDQACNRFRPDSEVSRLNRAGRTEEPASALFLEALASAQRAARLTDGAVDPTVGLSLLVLGYDRDYDEVRRLSSRLPLAGAPAPAPGWRCIEFDPENGLVAVPSGVILDLGATAKALCADRAANAIARELGVGVVVDIGGDLAVSGPPPVGGWQVAVREDSSSELDDELCSVSVWDGGLASSGTSVRKWSRGGTELHHIVDPTTGWPAPVEWRMVTVAAASCVDANAASTAAIVWGVGAPFRLAQLGLPARFVGSSGQVIEVGGWPSPVMESAPVMIDGARS